MPLLSTSGFRKIVDNLLFNAYTITPIGFFDGKAGVSLVLFELAQFTKDEKIENHAFHLLQEVFAHNTEYNNFNYGRAGIAFVLNYLINNKLLDADYADIYQQEQNKIIEEIKQICYKQEDCFKNIDYFLFINALSERIDEKEFNACEIHLIQHITTFFNETFTFNSVNTFYSCASKFLSICNSQNINFLTVKPVIESIWNTEQKLNKQDYLCEDTLYFIKKMIYHELNATYLSKYNLCISYDDPVKDVIIECLNIKEKISLIYDIYRLYGLNKKNDYRKKANSILGSLINEDLSTQEKLLLNNLPFKSEQVFGIGTGISRILLFHIYWDSIIQGIYPDRITQLLV